MPILDAHGRPIISQPKSRHELADALPARLRAGFDAARDTDEFKNYWANADALDADSAHSKSVRDKLIRRSRYEVANNGYADGMVQTHANFLVGRGPSLQMKTRSRAFNEMVETTWRAWGRAVRLRRKLWCLAHAKVQDGEAFAIIRENRGVRHDVQLDLVLIEAEQCTTPFLPFGAPGRIDGIEFDAWGNPVLYDILPQHPGGAWGYSYTFAKPERVAARWVLHWFHLRRPGQHRAIPEFCSTLNCGAAARRWREATIAAAETAAEFSALLKTTLIPDSEADPVAPMSAMEFQKRMVVALPMGWEAQQMKGEHPSTTFAEFHKANISEQARPKSQPYNLAAADSSSHNYASGRLDHQTYYLTLDVEREDANDLVLDPLFAEWFPVAARTFGWDRPNVLPPHEWSWPRYPIVDLRTEASSQTEHLKNGTLSLRRAYEETGLDFDEALPEMAEDYGVDEDEMRAILRKALFGGNGGANDPEDDETDGNAPRRMAAHGRTLVAAAKPDDRVLALSADVEIQAAEATTEGEQPGPRRFEVVAYTGGDLLLNGWDLPVVIDLRGLSASKSIVANLHHDSRQIVGHVTERKNDGTQLVLAGVVSGTGDGAREFIANHDHGFPWQASVEARPEKVVEIRAGRTVTVNGREYTGPLLVARKAKLYGIAFLPRGADENSSVRIAATQRKGGKMNEFDQWIDAMGFVADDLTDQQKTALRATFDREIAARAKDDDDEPVRLAVPAFDLDEIKAAAGEHYADLEVAFTEHEADVRDPKRLASIRAEAAKSARELKAQAIRERWPATRFEVEAIKAKAKIEKELILAQTPAGPAIHASTRDATPKVIEAALCLARNMPGVEKQYDEQTLEAAHRGFRNFGVQRLLLTAASANGYHCGPGERIDAGNIRTILRHAFPPIQAAGFSTLSVPDILSNLANKELLMGFQEEDQTWRQISRVASVNDFKQHSAHRMLDDMEYEELGPTGEIKHGELGEEKFTRQVRTYAKMFTLSREDIINDDLGAFDDLRNRIGRGAGRKFNNVFWSTFMNNSAFFTTARGNYKTGTGTALAVDGAGLQEGILLFHKLKSPDGKRLGGVPTILLVPPELQFVAQRLFQSTTVNTGGAATAESVPSDNIHAGKYRPVVVDWLSDSAFTGNSAKAWYLFRAPSVLASIVVSFLFGNQAPTVESAEADFNVLGVQFRGYHDFGVDHAEWLAGVKLKGET